MKKNNAILAGGMLKASHVLRKSLNAGLCDIEVAQAVVHAYLHYINIQQKISTAKFKHPSAIHPSEYLELLVRSMDADTYSDFLNDIKMTSDELNEFIVKKSSITTELAESLSIYYDEPSFWLKLQDDYDKLQ